MDNALVEFPIELYRKEVIERRGPWGVAGSVRLRLRGLEWADWFNILRFLGPLGYVRPAEFKEAYHRSQAQPRAAWLKKRRLRSFRTVQTF